MSKHELDALIRHSFGEEPERGDAESLAELKSQGVNVEALEAEFVQLKGDLRSLANVPECQLTKEHLRNAILSDGVKPKKAFPWWKPVLALAGGSLAVVAFLQLFPSGTINSDSNSVIAQNKNAQPEVNLPMVASNTEYDSSSSLKSLGSKLADRGGDMLIAMNDEPVAQPSLYRPVSNQSIRRSAPRMSMTHAQPANDSTEPNKPVAMMNKSQPSAADHGASINDSSLEGDQAPVLATESSRENVIVLGSSSATIPAAREESNDYVIFGG